MAIHDTGTGDNRTNAMPNTHDAKNIRKADGTQGITHKVDNTTGPYVTTNDGKIVVYDENDRAVIVIGIVAEYANEPLFVVAKDGYDVFTDILEV